MNAGHALRAGLAFSLASIPCPALDLVRDGQPTAVIITGTNAPHVTKYAAKELQHYLRKITGTVVPIQSGEPEDPATARVFVGVSDHARRYGVTTDGLSWDGYRIVSKRNALFLAGRDLVGPPITPVYGYPESYCNKNVGISVYGESGSLYAVYRFLEDHGGVRWYMPGELGEVVPASAAMSVPDGLDLTVVPDFEIRAIAFSYIGNSDDDARWYRQAGFGMPYLVNINHSFWQFKNRHGTNHMEYYALLPDGTRDYDRTGLGCGNLCMSEPGVTDAWVADLQKLFRNPHLKCSPVMPNDTFQKSACRCAKCQAQLQPELGATGECSRYVWDFVNTIAKESYKTHPDRLIGCLAGYVSYGQVPNGITFSPNVAAMMHRHRARYWDEVLRRKNNGELEGWRKVVPNIYSWNVYWWSSTWTAVAGRPLLFARVLSEDMQLLRGVSKGEITFAATSPRGAARSERRLYYPGLTHLTYYLTGRLLWDARCPVSDILDEYYVKFYGPAHAEMRAFWELAEATFTQPNPAGGNLLASRSALYTSEVMDRFRSLIAQGVAKTAPGSLYRQRLDLIKSELLPEIPIPTYTCRQTDTPPQIDGDASDPCWKTARRIRFVDGVGKPLPIGATGRVLWDGAFLYLTFTMQEPDPASLVHTATAGTDKAFWSDDMVELFLDADPVSAGSCLQYAVNANGALWHRRYDGPGASAPAPASRARAAGRIAAKSWTVELAIPLEEVGLTDPQGRSLAANFMRDRPAGDVTSYSYWSPTLSGAHRTPARFGSILLR